jgi:Sec-independent protein secretion pathway component TatC
MASPDLCKNEEKKSSAFGVVIFVLFLVGVFLYFTIPILLTVCLIFEVFKIVL